MTDMAGEQKPMSLLELLTRTKLQIFTYEQETMKKNAYPNGMGSGFFFLHKDRMMLVTADHVCHPFDHEPGRTQRVFEDKDVALVNNWVEKDANGVDMPILTPVGGFYYFDKFKVDIDKGIVGDFKPFDATFAILGKARFQKPFKNEGLQVVNGPTIPAGLDMIPIPTDAVVEPEENDRYICYGHTNFGLAEDGVHLKWDTTIHEEMKYKCDCGDYYVLTPSEAIVNKDWEGISGAPVLNQKGGLLGILCGGDPVHNDIYVLNMKKVLSLIDTTLRIEEIEAHCKK